MTAAVTWGVARGTGDHRFLGPWLVQFAQSLVSTHFISPVVMISNTAIGSMTPPEGTVMFKVRSVTRCSVEDFTKAFVTFLIASIRVLFLLAYVPALVTFLPNLMLEGR